jgi:hypothetical protein
MVGHFLANKFLITSRVIKVIPLYICFRVSYLSEISIHLQLRNRVQKFPVWRKKASPNGKCCEGYIAPSKVRLMFHWKVWWNKGYWKIAKLLHNGERPFACKVCHKAFSHQSSLIKHLRIHTGERPYTCDVCNKTFNQQSNLIIHQRIHSGERPYACGVCNKAFSQQNHLIKHHRTHSGELPYTCKVCYKAFAQKDSLIIHQRIHSGERP